MRWPVPDTCNSQPLWLFQTHSLAGRQCQPGEACFSWRCRFLTLTVPACFLWVLFCWVDAFWGILLTRVLSLFLTTTFMLPG